MGTAKLSTWEEMLAEAARRREAMTPEERSDYDEEHRVRWAWGNLMCTTNHQPSCTYEEFRARHWRPRDKRGETA